MKNIRKCTGCGYNIAGYDFGVTLCSVCQNEDYYPGADKEDNWEYEVHELGKLEPLKVGGPKFELDPDITDPDAWNTLRKDELKALSEKSYADGYARAHAETRAIIQNSYDEHRDVRNLFMDLDKMLNDFNIPRWPMNGWDKKASHSMEEVTFARVKWLLERSVYRIDEMGVVPPPEQPF